LSHGNDVEDVKILQQSDFISDHYLFHLAKAEKPTPCYGNYRSSS